MKLSYLAILIFLLSSCSLSILSGDKDLGKGYILWVEGEGGSSNCIIKSKEPYRGGGIEVIPPTVLNVNYNEEKIIVLTRDLETNEKLFWIINKDVSIDLDADLDLISYDSILISNIDGPLDSLTFYRIKKERKIDLNFRY